MLVFIDDSGDPGFDMEKGSSSHFVISSIIFRDNLEAEKTAIAVKEYKRQLKIPDNVEFKFNKSSKKTRIGFLEKINKFEYKIRCIVFDKSIVRSNELKNNKNKFYGYAIKTLLSHTNHSILNAKIRIDGSGNRIFRKSFLTYLRTQLNTKNEKIVENCKLVDSKSDVLIQMADMIAGSIRRSYDKYRNDGKEYKKIIKKHVEDEWVFS